MTITFYIAAVIAILSTLMVITRKNAVHALLYLIVSLLSIAVIFFSFGAHFVAALEVVIYAGAIMVLFIFVVMMLNLGKESEEKESQLLSKKGWIGPGILTLILFIEFIITLAGTPGSEITVSSVTPKDVGITLFNKYALGVELAAMLLMAGIIGAYHIGRTKRKVLHRFLQEESDNK